MKERWVSLNDLVQETGYAVRTLQYIRKQEPGVLTTRQRGSTAEYKQPDCAVNLRNREVAKESAKLRADEADEAKERARKMRADADRSEMLSAKLRGELAPVADMDRAVERMASAVRNEVAGLRARYALVIVGLQSPQEAARVLDDMAKQILASLVDRAYADVEDEGDEKMEEAA